MIKTLSIEELKVLLSCQKSFNQHFAGAPNNFSFIAKIYGIYTLTDDQRADIHFAIMENIIPPNAEIVAIFDLKGSRRHRLTLRDPSIHLLSQLSPDSVYKDLDFLQTLGTLPLRPPDFAHLLEHLTADVALLETLGVMDYSLLVAVVERGCEGSRRIARTEGRETEVVFGIIDYLQKFNWVKKLEQVGKRITSPGLRLADTSCVNPHYYAERFLTFISTVFSPSPE